MVPNSFLVDTVPIRDFNDTDLIKTGLKNGSSDKILGFSLLIIWALKELKPLKKRNSKIIFKVAILSRKKVNLEEKNW